MLSSEVLTRLPELLSPIASVHRGGAISLGKNVVADGYLPKRLVRVITHAHNDHTVGIRKSLGTSAYIIATAETFELMENIMGVKIPKSKKVVLNYDERVIVKDEVIVLKKAEHIPGSAQVMVESNGITIAYTGDFKKPGEGTEILEPHILILDATYGCRSCVRKFKDSIIEELIELIDRELRTFGRITIKAYHGKIQEIMLILREYGFEVPFVMPERIYKATKALEKLGYRFGELLREEEAEGDFIYFTTKTCYKYGTLIELDGWLLTKPLLFKSPNHIVVGFSDHADLEEILYYLDVSRPGVVIVDCWRNRNCKETVSILREKFRSMKVFGSPQP